jgi:hypothetical protein
MRKLVLAFGVMLGLFAAPGVANAVPIGINACADGAPFYECDIYADYDDGVSTLGGLEGNLGGYLVGYTFLLNAGADLTTFEAGDVAHILVIHDSLFELFSNIAASFVFNSVFDSARTGADIDSTPVTAGQLAGCPPVPSGVPTIDGVGYCTSADVVTLYPNWDGGNDLLRINTALSTETQPAPVPEPGTLSLLVFGGSAVAAAVLRRRASNRR